MEPMQLTEMMYALRNPAGVPFYPIVFVGLGVLTFALHIFFVQLMLGTAALTLYGAYKQENHWRRLASSVLRRCCLCRWCTTRNGTPQTCYPRIGLSALL